MHIGSPYVLTGRGDQSLNGRHPVGNKSWEAVVQYALPLLSGYS